jgi:4-amino-4-deoxy-L-arabinose transferase-like glycosyltransferase
MTNVLLPKILAKRRNILVLLALFCLAVYLPGITALPPFDRDEARFVQATKQMLESGDLIDIRFQERPRYKKPAGIHWLQAASVSLFGGGNQAKLWAYRLPSLLGALAGVLLLFFFGEKFFDRRTGALAALLLGSSTVLTAEAHLAKTDAVLLCCTVLAQGGLGVIYLRRDGKKRLYALLFWLGIGAGTMIKGPILAAVSFLTIAALLLTDRDRSWLGDLNFRLGIPLFLLIVLPWFAAIYLVSDGAFFRAALGGDMLAKVSGGREAHGAFPGYYTLLATATLFPASLFMFPAFVAALRERLTPAIRFCLAWIVPAWLMFEMVPTKLVHYVLPLYPALALLIADRLLQPPAGRGVFFRKWTLVPYGFWGLAGAALVGAAVYGTTVLGSGPGLSAAAACLGGLLVVAAGYFFLFRRDPVRAVIYACLLTIFLYGPLFQFVLPQLDKLWLSPRIALIVNALQQETKIGGPVFIAGYREPSVVFLLGTDTRFGNGGAAAQYLLDEGGRTTARVAVVDKENTAGFAGVFAEAGIPVPASAGEISGLNYSRGRWKELNVYVFP